MRLSDLHYDLPETLIAQHPVEPRDASRLLVLHRADGRIEHRAFRDIRDYLRGGDRLVLNNTRVIPARFFCRRHTGGRVEALYLCETDGLWRLLLKPSARLKPGELLTGPDERVELELVERLERGEWTARPTPTVDPLAWLAANGQTPLPPYIHREGGPVATDPSRYQTVYAETPGAVAAPTAGLHFTPELLAGLGEQGVERTEVTLHVGVGTFQPIAVDDLADHQMHSEWRRISPTAVADLDATRRRGGRLVAVGTTATRVLESLPGRLGADDPVALAGEGWTDVFIYPPYAFRNVDALVTNFHLPGSTLIALVMAFATPELIRSAYEAAIAERYRFYSYGDAMLIV